MIKVVVLFFLLLAGACWFGKLHYYVLAGYAGISLVTFMIYAWDKRQAKAAGQRTRESTLQLLSLLGGWPGAWLAQQHLRHKSQKKPFLRVFWGTVVLNLGVLLYLGRLFW